MISASIPEEEECPLKLHVSLAVSRNSPRPNFIQKTLAAISENVTYQTFSSGDSNVSMPNSQNSSASKNGLGHQLREIETIRQPIVKLLPRKFKKKVSTSKSAVCGVLNRSHRVTKGVTLNELLSKRDADTRCGNFTNLYGETDDAETISGVTVNPSESEIEKKGPPSRVDTFCFDDTDDDDDPFYDSLDNDNVSVFTSDNRGDFVFDNQRDRRNSILQNHSSASESRSFGDNVDTDGASNRRSLRSESPHRESALRSRSQINDVISNGATYFEFPATTKDGRGNDENNVRPSDSFLTPPTRGNNIASESRDLLNFWNKDRRNGNAGARRSIPPDNSSSFISESFFVDQDRNEEIIDLTTESSPSEHALDTNSTACWDSTILKSSLTTSKYGIENDCNFLNAQENGEVKDGPPPVTSCAKLNEIVEEGNEVYFCKAKSPSKCADYDDDDVDDGIDVRSPPMSVESQEFRNSKFLPFVCYRRNRTLVLEELDD